MCTKNLPIHVKLYIFSSFGISELIRGCSEHTIPLKDLLVGENSVALIINPHVPSAFFHPYEMDESMSNFMGVWWTFYILILFLIEIPVSKQRWPWSDAAAMNRFKQTVSGMSIFSATSLLPKDIFFSTYIACRI